MAIRTRSIRLDDEVWGKMLELLGVYGTHNAGMRAVFGLSGLRSGFDTAAQAEAFEAHQPKAGVDYKELVARAFEKRRK